MVREEEKSREVNIVQEKDQLAVRIPKNMEEIFDIDTAKDKFLWHILERDEGLILEGSLLKNVREGENNG